MVISFVCPVPVRPLRPNMAALYHENGKLQGILDNIQYILREKVWHPIYLNWCWQKEGRLVKQYGHWRSCSGQVWRQGPWRQLQVLDLDLGKKQWCYWGTWRDVASPQTGQTWWLAQHHSPTCWRSSATWRRHELMSFDATEKFILGSST